jgi:hypothetical protein
LIAPLVMIDDLGHERPFYGSMVESRPGRAGSGAFDAGYERRDFRTPQFLSMPTYRPFCSGTGSFA